MEENKKLQAKLMILTDALLEHIPDEADSKKEIIDWLNESPYSPYITLYGGKNSKTFNSKDSFTVAHDGLTRYKINDDFIIKLENFTNFDNKIISANTSLENVIQCEELFKAYPDFRNIQVSMNISKNNKGFESGGNYYLQNKLEVFADNTLSAMKILLHEIQHSIQIKEGFAVGSSFYNEYGLMESVKSVSQKEKRGIYNVQYNGKNASPLYKDLETKKKNARYSKGKTYTYTNPQGKRVEIGYGARHIRKHLNRKRNGWVHTKELLDIGLILRESPYVKSKGKKVYEFSNDRGIEFRLIADRRDVITFYSKRKVKSQDENTIAVSKSYSFQKDKEIDLEISKSERVDNFKKWFGKSQVMNINDEPLIVYHGGFSDFESFDASRGETSQFGRGVYLTSSARDASNYASKDVSVNFDIPAKAEWLSKECEIPYIEAKEEVTRGNEQVYPVYVKMENPLHLGGSTIESTLYNVETSMKFAGVERADYKSKVFVFMDELAKSGVQQDSKDYWDFLQNNTYELNPFSTDKLLKRFDYNPFLVQMDFLTFKGARELMITENKDGIIYHNVDNLFSFMEEGSKHFFVRKPENIKSIHNIGNFDINSSNIMEKNDLGMRYIEKALSIVPTGTKTETVKDYLLFNSITHESLRGTVYQNILNDKTYTNIFEKEFSDITSENPSYQNSLGEIEAREIEDVYIETALSL